jgi:multidrug resistance efflux pump
VKRFRWAIAWLVVASLLSGCGVAGRVVAPSSSETLTEEMPAEEATAALTPVASSGTNVILVDGELVARYPLLKLAFASGATGVLLSCPVRVGQMVKQGELIAALDDTELRRAVDDAQKALTRALQDKEKADADAERKYQQQTQDAEDKYNDELDSAETQYQRDLRDAQRALYQAQQALEQAQMQPPTTNVTEAETNLAQALDQEAQAADNYKQALDRPWEPQSMRDSLYREWQTRIKERELAQLKLQDARTALQVYYMDIKSKEQDVENARVDLAGVKKDTTKRDVVEKEVNLSYDRAVEDARQKLEDAQSGLKKASLYAPWDGLIYSVDAAIGETIGSGTSIVSLLNVQDVYFVTQNLSERHVAQIEPGQKAQVTLRAYPDVTLTGQVEALRPQLDRKADSEARFAAYIRLDGNTLSLLPGMTGRVEIMLVED